MEEDISYILSEIENYNRDNAYLLDIEELFEAIEHLIKAYKELEEYKKIAELTQISCCTAQNCGALNNSIKNALENMKLKEKIKELEEFKKQVTEIENTNFIKYKNYIPVSLVKEKIEELDKEKLKYDNDLRIYTLRNTFDFQKEVLQELLREE